MDLWELERGYLAQGATLLCGADEAGAGPLAGPVYGAAVILPPGWTPVGLDDSKKLSEKTRARLFDEICAGAVAWAVASASVEEIDRLNILNARFLAMDRAIRALEPAPQFALIDGNRTTGISVPCAAVVGGDGRSASIAAASVLAKVSRDRHMAALAAQYPQYAFERHKGYPTKLHYELLRAHGPSSVHRKSFLKKL